jgi:hypothetical protein
MAKSLNETVGVISLLVFKSEGKVGVGVGVGVGTGVGSIVGVGDATGFGLVIATPLFQTSFFPLFTHVNFLPAEVEVCPAFLHFAPALTAALALIGVIRAKIRSRDSRSFFISKVSRVIRGIATTRPDNKKARHRSDGPS